MKIRGNVVGTPLNPEKIAERIGDVARHYASLHDALNDTDASTTGKVKVVGSTITLVADLEETKPITFNTDTELVLNGHKLSMTSPGYNIIVAEGASLVVNGTKDGSAINVSGQSTGTISLFDVKGNLEINGGNYIVDVDNGQVSVCIRGAASSEYVKINNCSLSCKSLNYNALVVQYVGGELRIANSTLATDSYSGSAGVRIQSDAFIDNSAITVKAETLRSYAVEIYPKSTLAITNSQIEAETYGTYAYGILTLSNDNHDTDMEIIADNIKVISTTHHVQVDGAIPDEDGDATKEDDGSNNAQYGGSTGILNRGVATITNSVILSDAKSEKSKSTCGVGIGNIGTLTCENVQVYGTHSGIQHVSHTHNYEHYRGDLYVKNSFLSGVSHGGLYIIIDQDAKAVVSDTILEAGVYRGQFTEYYKELFKPTPDPLGVSALAAMYFGDHNAYITGGDLYMDNCTFVGLAGESFVVRPQGYTTQGVLANGMSPNKLYISRSKIAVRKVTWDASLYGTIAKIRLNRLDGDPGDDAGAHFSFLYCGDGCNFTTDDLGFSENGKNGANQFITTGLYYRRKIDDDNQLVDDYFTPSPDDYRLQTVTKQGGDDASLAEISIALDNIIDLQEELIGL